MDNKIKLDLIGRNVHFLRISRGYTQQQLAEELYCDVRQIRRYEGGTNSIAVINELADFFEVSAIDLISVDMEKEVNLNPALVAGF